MKCARCPAEARPDRITCARCGKKLSLQMTEHQKKNREAGKCWCGRPPMEGFKCCPDCREKWKTVYWAKRGKK